MTLAGTAVSVTIGPDPIRTRREQILATAAQLFSRRGYHGVSVTDICAACGISGPALYKLFPSKDAVLALMLVSISEELLGVGRERSVAAPRRPGRADLAGRLARRLAAFVAC
jgi:AcrR family transcriptional regulator